MATDVVSQLAEATSKLSINDEDDRLIHDLVALSKKSPKLVRSSEYAAPVDPNVKIRSWKMNEFKYYDIPSPFPTLARGLFTREVEQGGRPRYKIVARGYDKFFNIGEVPWTTVSRRATLLYLLEASLITDSSVVGIIRGSYKASVCSYAQGQRMHHLHRSPFAHSADRNI